MTHSQIIDLWPSLSEFAADLGLRYGTAKAMRRRGSIPADYWAVAVARAADRGLTAVTLEALAEAISVKIVPPAGEVAA